MTHYKQTPMIKQYLSIKDKYTDAILFYRMGDFYEMFFEDAKIASKILEITLTSRNKKDSFPVPMCGIPYKAAKNYIARLIENGYKVAICDQIKEPGKASSVNSKGLVKRDVVRVITPGMIIENELLDEKSNNYILAAHINKNTFGFAYLDISTGAFNVSETNDLSTIIDEIRRIAPSEILISESTKESPLFSSIIKALSDKLITYIDDMAFDYNQSRSRLTAQFKTLTLEGFGCEKINVGVSAAGAIIYYVRETQKQKTNHITKIEPYFLNSFLLLDDITFRNLEITQNLRTGSKKGTLIGIIDHTITAMGSRLLKKWLRYPLINVLQIDKRLDAVEEAKNKIQVTFSIRQKLKSVYDIERICSKILMGHSNARDLITLMHSLEILAPILKSLSNFNAGLFQLNDKKENNFSLQGIFNLVDFIKKAIREDSPPVTNEGRMIKTGFNEKLDELIMISKDAKGWLARLEIEQKNETKITSLKVRYNKVFGYYIEVPKAHIKSVPLHYIRKQTLVNAERYITQELKSFESKALDAQDKRAELEYKILTDVNNKIIKQYDSIQQVAEFIAEIDCLLNFAHIADQNNYSKPEINTDGTIIIEDGRHPVIENMITGERFIPNTIKMNNDKSQILIITGPNMSGKSTVLRQIAIIILLSQIGSFVPAHKALISVTDKIFSRVGALDNLAAGQSTFMVEMEETAGILNCATSDSLVIMDEIGRGTSTLDGLSIAWAVAEYLHDLNGKGVKTLFATHYHELIELEKTKPHVKNYNIAVNEINDEIIFLRKLVKGGTNRSYGIQVARLAGIPASVLTRAKKILYNLEKKNNRLNDFSLFSQTQNSINNEKNNISPDSAEHNIIKKLKKLDISKMTPIEALNYLDNLQKTVQT